MSQGQPSRRARSRLAGGNGPDYECTAEPEPHLDQVSDVPRKVTSASSAEACARANPVNASVSNGSHSSAMGRIAGVSQGRTSVAGAVVGAGAAVGPAAQELLDDRGVGRGEGPVRHAASAVPSLLGHRCRAGRCSRVRRCGVCSNPSLCPADRGACRSAGGRCPRLGAACPFCDTLCPLSGTCQLVPVWGFP